jgi:hypothetical protein
VKCIQYAFSAHRIEMIKVACLTCFVPRRENIDGPNGLLYQILKWCPSNYQVTVFLFSMGPAPSLDYPEVQDLLKRGVRFVCCDKTLERYKVPRYWPLGARLIACNEMPTLGDYDTVWAYPYWFAPYLRDVKKPVLISGMDCATLLYFRKIKNTPVVKPAKFIRAVVGLVINACFEKYYLRGRFVHVVGKADARVLKRLGVHSRYIPHPFLDYQPHKQINLRSRDILTILISNPGDSIYGSTRYLRWIKQLFDKLRSEPAIQLIVHKGSKKAVRSITDVALNYTNVSLQFIKWVDDYGRLLSAIDIQLFPLDIGAGTKTSVLTALQHGVRAICSEIAAENIEPNCLLFEADLASCSFESALLQAVKSVKSDDKQNVEVTSLEVHQPQRCAHQFWNHLKNDVI